MLRLLTKDSDRCGGGGGARLACALLVLALGTWLCTIPPTEAQLIGTRYLHSDTLAVTVAGIDTTWTTPWDFVIIYCQTADINIKIGGPDTTSWSLRPWLPLPTGAALSIGPSPKLKRIQATTASGTATAYLIGYKGARQY